MTNLPTNSQARRHDPRSLYAIAMDVGLRYSVPHRFATGERTAINVVTAEKLCETLGLKLRPALRMKKGH